MSVDTHPASSITVTVYMPGPTTMDKEVWPPGDQLTMYGSVPIAGSATSSYVPSPSGVTVAIFTVSMHPGGGLGGGGLGGGGDGLGGGGLGGGGLGGGGEGGGGLGGGGDVSMNMHDCMSSQLVPWFTWQRQFMQPS